MPLGVPEGAHTGPPNTPHTTIMKITNDPMTGKAAQTSQYASEFAKLTPESNCIVFESKKEMERVSQALDNWAQKHVGTGAKVKTTARYPADGLPRCWLIYPASAIPAKTAIRGNFPKAA